jgi:hypothetical protein
LLSNFSSYYGLPAWALIADAIKIIVDRLGSQLYSVHLDRFLFAIPVHSMESWLLLCLFDVDQPKNSFDRLNRQLKRKNNDPLAKTSPSYTKISREIKRKRLLELGAGKNSLGLFLAKLIELGRKKGSTA